MDLRRNRTLNILKLFKNNKCNSTYSGSSSSIFDDSDADKDNIQLNKNKTECSTTR